MATGSIQQRLESCAASVGYAGSVRGLPKEATRNEKVARFLQWLCEQLVPAHAFSQSELDRLASSDLFLCTLYAI